MSRKRLDDDVLDKLQRDTFDYFLKETNPRNGLVPDSTREGAPSSIGTVGLALAAYAAGAERKFIARRRYQARAHDTDSVSGDVPVRRGDADRGDAGVAVGAVAPQPDATLSPLEVKQ